MTKRKAEDLITRQFVVGFLDPLEKKGVVDDSLITHTVLQFCLQAIGHMEGKDALDKALKAYRKGLNV